MTGAQIIVRPGNRVANKLLAAWQAERHVLKQLAVHARRESLFGDQRAPSRIACVARCHLWQDVLTHRRADAVSSDKQLRFDGFAIGKMRSYCAGILREFCDATPTV